MIAHETYRVKIEPSRIGGYLVIVSSKKGSYVNIEHVDTVDAAKAWARAHVAWLRDKEPAVEYEL